MISPFLRVALILGLVSAIGPFAIDMYLPALPSIGTSLGASAAAVQMSLTVFFITTGICQLFYGPLSDIIGRKPPILFGLALFAAGSIGCALAPSIEVLIAFRIVEAVGACAGMSIPRAIVRDMHTGPEATRLMSLLMLVFSISPILAPLTGSVVINIVGWRGIFWAVTLAAILGFILMSTMQPETRLAGARKGSTWWGAVAGYRKLLADRSFMGLTLVSAFGVSSFFVYIAHSSFVLINHYGLSPTDYSLLFALNAVSFFASAQLTGWLTGKFGLVPVIRKAVAGFALVMVAMFVTVAMGMDRLEVIAALLFVGYGFLGLVMPTTGVLSLEDHGDIAGTASALGGALQMITGATIMAISGYFANGTALPMVTGIAACAVMAFLLAGPSLKSVPRA